MKRSGLSLIEILVVIAIIAVLAGLLLPALFGIVGVTEESQVRSEINQLGLGVEGFKNRFGFYPLSKIRLCGSEASYGNSPLDLASRTVIRRMFPDIDWVDMDWDGDGQPDGDATLDGAQCLVFFLMGPGGRGFATDPRNPTAPGGTRHPRTHLNSLSSAPFPRYLDRYGQPYLFFSTVDAENGYTIGDCPQLAGGPYFTAPGKFANPTSFQIISAGRDGRFGNTSDLGALALDAQDNLTNFGLVRGQ